MKKKLTWNYMALFFSLQLGTLMGMTFFIKAFIGILREQKVPLENLGFIYMLGLFFVFRFLWAPVIDRIHFKKMGHYRIWAIIFQSLMIITVLLISFFNVIDDLKLIVFLVVLFYFFTASQSVALSAFSYKITFKKQRPTINTIKSLGGLFGGILGGAIGLILYEYVAWQYTVLIMATIMAISLIQLFFSSEPLSEDSNLTEKVDYGQFFSFWKTKEKKLWFILLILYPVTVSASFGITTPILVDLGWSLDKIGFIYIVGTSVGFIANFGTTYVINKFGKKNILVFSAIGLNISFLMLLLIFKYQDSYFLIMIMAGFMAMFHTPSQILITTIMMDLSSKKTPASQFAVQHCVFMFSGILVSSLSLSLSGVFGYEKVIIFCAFIGLCSIYLSTKIDIIMKKDKYKKTNNALNN